MLFHTSYQTDRKTPSLRFDFLVTHVGAVSYDDAAGLLSVGTRERMSFIFFFPSRFSAVSEQLDLLSHQNLIDLPEVKTR